MNFSRKLIMGIAAVLTLSAILIKYVGSVELVIILLSTVFFAHGFWITNYITSISDIFGNTTTSTIVGLSGSAGAISALIINPLIGVIITKFSYDPLWIYAGSMYLVAFIAFVIFIPKIRAIETTTM